MSAESEFVYHAAVSRPNGQDLAWVLIGEHGAIELWSFVSPGYDPRRADFKGDYLGGVEVHSRSVLFDWASEPTANMCDYLRGPCWADGSALAAMLLLPRAFNGEDMRSELRDWYDVHLAPAVTS